MRLLLLRNNEDSVPLAECAFFSYSSMKIWLFPKKILALKYLIFIQKDEFLLEQITQLHFFFIRVSLSLIPVVSVTHRKVAGELGSSRHSPVKESP